MAVFICPRCDRTEEGPVLKDGRWCACLKGAEFNGVVLEPVEMRIDADA